MLHVECPACSAKLKVKESLLGKTAKCPSCGQQIRLEANPVPPPIISSEIVTSPPVHAPKEMSPKPPVQSLMPPPVDSSLRRAKARTSAPKRRYTVLAVICAIILLSVIAAFPLSRMLVQPQLQPQSTQQTPDTHLAVAAYKAAKEYYRTSQVAFGNAMDVKRLALEAVIEENDSSRDEVLTAIDQCIEQQAQCEKARNEYMNVAQDTGMRYPTLEDAQEEAKFAGGRIKTLIEIRRLTNLDNERRMKNRVPLPDSEREEYYINEFTRLFKGQIETIDEQIDAERRTIAASEKFIRACSTEGIAH
jgi:hypothetical protein